MINNTQLLNERTCLDQMRGEACSKWNTLHFLWGFQGALCLERMCIMGVLGGK